MGTRGTWQAAYQGYPLRNKPEITTKPFFFLLPFCWVLRPSENIYNNIRMARINCKTDYSDQRIRFRRIKYWWGPVKRVDVLWEAISNLYDAIVYRSIFSFISMVIIFYDGEWLPCATRLGEMKKSYDHFFRNKQSRLLNFEMEWEIK